jgi:phosphoribosylamine-glycine ligase
LLNTSEETAAQKIGWTSSALLAFPPYPYHNDLPVEDTPKMPGVVAGVLKHIYPIGMKEIGSDFHVVGGEVCYALGGGDNFAEAVRRMYRTLGNIEVTNSMYRTDIGRNVQGHLYNLEK